MSEQPFEAVEPEDAEHGLPEMMNSVGVHAEARGLRTTVARVRDKVLEPLTSHPPRFVTRAAWGARPPRSAVSSNITPRGVALHYEGPDMGVKGPQEWDHSLCAGYVRNIQNFHLDTRRWADIAYSALVCPHGYIYEGRGVRKRTAANGTNAGNQNYYAVCGLWGENDAFTPAAKEGYNAAINWLRSAGGAGNDVKGHRDFKPTACPGDPAYNWLKAGRPAGSVPPAPGEKVTPPSPPGHNHATPLVTSAAQARAAGVRNYTSQGDAVRDLQGHLNYALRSVRGFVPLTTDADCGAKTVTAIRQVQSMMRLTVDGLCGDSTWKGLHALTRGARLTREGKGF